MPERRCASPSAREQRSLDDTEEKNPKKADKDRAEAAGQPDKVVTGDKAEKTPNPPKADRPEKAAEGKATPEPREPEPKVPARLKVEFDEQIRGRLAGEFGYKNRFQIPTLDKVVINMGIGEGVADRKKVDAAAADLARISAQKAVVTL